MIRSIILMNLAILSCELAQPAFAQQAVLTSGALILSGYPANCGEVRTVVAPIYDLAESWRGWIYLSPRLFLLPRAQQLFWYTHECAHQIFGPSEAIADCWAARQGKIKGWLTAIELEGLLDMVRTLPGDAAHAVGPVRAEDLRRCYDG